MFDSGGQQLTQVCQIAYWRLHTICSSIILDAAVKFILALVGLRLCHMDGGSRRMAWPHHLDPETPALAVYQAVHRLQDTGENKGKGATL